MRGVTTGCSERILQEASLTPAERFPLPYQQQRARNPARRRTRDAGPSFLVHANADTLRAGARRTRRFSKRARRAVASFRIRSIDSSSVEVPKKEAPVPPTAHKLARTMAACPAQLGAGVVSPEMAAATSAFVIDSPRSLDLAATCRSGAERRTARQPHLGRHARHRFSRKDWSVWIPLLGRFPLLPHNNMRVSERSYHPRLRRSRRRCNRVVPAVGSGTGSGRQTRRVPTPQWHRASCDTLRPWIVSRTRHVRPSVFRHFSFVLGKHRAFSRHS